MRKWLRSFVWQSTCSIVENDRLLCKKKLFEFLQLLKMTIKKMKKKKKKNEAKNKNEK